MLADFDQQLANTLAEIRSQGLYKTERIITSPQAAQIEITGGRRVLNMCANNYLGLADHPALIAAAKEALDTHGFGLASVRFICGTQDIHKDLEGSLTKFLGTEDTILYPSAFDANGGLFETLLGPEDAVISDELNHASIIDGIRLCKAQRFRYKHNDMADLEAKLREAAGARVRLIATDGCFSMDGTIAELGAICDLAEKYQALTMIDDAHASGFLGKTGRGTHEYRGVMGKIDIITGTLGKALGGASGGFTSGRKRIVELLRQRSRPYLFSNTVAPPIVAASIKALELLTSSTELRDKLEENTNYFRAALTERGLTIKPGTHPIVPIMLGDAALSQKFAARMLEKGVYVIGFFYPVVPHGTARVRTQVSAAHSREDLEFAVNAFAETNDGAEAGVGRPCRPRSSNKRATRPPLHRVQRDVRADPGLFLIEVDPHHFALTHPHQIIYQDRLASIRPDEHHPDFRLRFSAVDRANKFRVRDFFLQDPLLRLFQRAKFLARRLHVHAQPSEGIERFEDVIIDRFALGKFVGKERRRGVLRFQKRQRVFADPEIPVRVPDPLYVQLVLKSERRVEIWPPNQLIENDAIVNALDPHFPSIAVVEELRPAFANLRQANRPHPQERFGAGEIDSRFLLLGFDLEQDHVLGIRVAHDYAPQ